MVSKMKAPCILPPVAFKCGFKCEAMNSWLPRQPLSSASKTTNIMENSGWKQEAEAVKKRITRNAFINGSREKKDKMIRCFKKEPKKQ